MKVKIKTRTIDVDLLQYCAMKICIMLIITFVFVLQTTCDINAEDYFYIETSQNGGDRISFGLEVINLPKTFINSSTNISPANNLNIIEFDGLCSSDTIEITREIEYNEGPDLKIISDASPSELVNQSMVEEVVTEQYILEDINDVEYYLDLSDEEFEMFARLVEAEVTGTASSLAQRYKCSENDIFMSKLRVARVIINRVLSPKFKNTMEGVIFERNQFSPILDKRYWKVTITDTTREACRAALDKSVPDDIPNGLYFTAGSFKNKRLSKIGINDAVGHSFYIEK